MRGSSPIVLALRSAVGRGEKNSIRANLPYTAAATRIHPCSQTVHLMTCWSTRRRASRLSCGLANPWGCGRSFHRSDTRPLDRGSELCTSRRSAVVPNFGSDRSEPDIPRALAAYRSGESDPLQTWPPDSRNSDLLEYWTVAHSGLMPASLITLPHFSVSAATSFPNSAGVIGMGWPPSSARRACNLGSANTAFTA